MRYRIREATPLDGERVAELIDETGGDWSGTAAGAIIHRLQEVWRLGLRVWLAIDEEGGVPAALFGIAPAPDDADSGGFWILAFDAFDDTDQDSRSAGV